MPLIQKLYFDFPNILAFSTGRSDGFSDGNFGGFNISPFAGDDTMTITKNRNLLLERLKINNEQLIFPYQTHDDKILIIDNHFLSMPVDEQNFLLQRVDALICTVQNICIGVNTADCVPVLLYDEALKITAAIHAGWRGITKSIINKTIALMVKQFGCNPTNINAAIGPCISAEVYEVGPELLLAFEQAGFRNESIFLQNPLRVDLVKAAEIQLLACGIVGSKIEKSSICTFRQSDKFFSARKLGIRSGRCFNAIIMLDV